MSLSQAIILVNSMAKANKEIFFNNDLFLDNISGECLRYNNVIGGYDKIIEYYKGGTLSVKQIRIVWNMASNLLLNCNVEMD